MIIPIKDERSIDKHMKPKKKRRSRSRRRRQRLMIKYSKLGLILMITIFLGQQIATKLVNKMEERKQQQLMLEAAKLEEERRLEIERLEEEKRRLEEERKNSMLIGTTIEGREYAYDAEKLSSYEYPDGKVVFLTFDDGPSTTNTPDVLDILEEKGVKATFFITGQNLANGGERAANLLKATFEAGHAIANHSWSHNYNVLYPGGSLDINAFVEDYQKTDELLKDILGDNFYTRVIRCPGGYFSWNNMEPLDQYLKENDRHSIDWNALNGDAEGKKKSASELVDYAIETSQGKDTVILLMHDTYGKEETVKALPEIIDYFKENGYVFKTIA